MRRLTSCDHCHNDIYVQDVYKTVKIPKAPQYLALIYKCSECKMAGKISSHIDEWEVAQEDSEKTAAEYDRIIKAALLELDDSLTAHIMIAWWNAYPYPPRIERGKYEKKYSQSS